MDRRPALACGEVVLRDERVDGETIRAAQGVLHVVEQPRDVIWQQLDVDTITGHVAGVVRHLRAVVDLSDRDVEREPCLSCGSVGVLSRGEAQTEAQACNQEQYADDARCGDEPLLGSQLAPLLDLNDLVVRDVHGHFVSSRVMRM